MFETAEYKILALETFTFRFISLKFWQPSRIRHFEIRFHFLIMTIYKHFVNSQILMQFSGT